MTKELSTITELKNDFDLKKEVITSLLPKTVSFSKFKETAISAIVNNKDLLFLKNKESLFRSVTLAAQAGVLPDGKRGAIVKYGNDCSFMIMMKGVVEVILQQENVRSLSVDVIFDIDKYTYKVCSDYRDGFYFEHSRPLGERGNIIGAYALLTFKDDSKKIAVIDKIEINRSKNVAKSKSIWNNWEDEMTKKTVIHRLAKTLCLSERMDAVIESIHQDSDFKKLSYTQKTQTTPKVPKVPQNVSNNNIKQGKDGLPDVDDFLNRQIYVDGTFIIIKNSLKKLDLNLSVDEKTKLIKDFFGTANKDKILKLSLDELKKIRTNVSEYFKNKGGQK